MSHLRDAHWRLIREAVEPEAKNQTIRRRRHA